MRFDITMAGYRPDCSAIQAAIDPIDPTAVIDLAPSGNGLRVFTLLDAVQLTAFMRKLGYPVARSEVQSQPSACCTTL